MKRILKNGNCACRQKGCAMCQAQYALKQERRDERDERRHDSLRPRASEVLDGMGVRLEEAVQALMGFVIRTGQLPFQLRAPLGVDDPGQTPRSNALELTRERLAQERTPVYGDALALCRELERENSALQRALVATEKENEKLEDKLERYERPAEPPAPQFVRPGKKRAVVPV